MSTSSSFPSARKPFAIGADVAVAALLLGFASYAATKPDSSPWAARTRPS